MHRGCLIFILLFAVACIGWGPMMLSVKPSTCTEKQNLGASDDTTGEFGDNNTMFAGSFTTPGTGYSIRKVSVKFAANTGSPTGNINAEVWTDSGSPGPSTQTGADSSTVDVSTISAGYVDFVWASAISLSASTRYWIVLDDGSADASHYQNVRYIGTGSEHIQRYAEGWINLDNSCQMTMITYSGNCS